MGTAWVGSAILQRLLEPLWRLEAAAPSVVSQCEGGEHARNRRGGGGGGRDGERIEIRADGVEGGLVECKTIALNEIGCVDVDAGALGAREVGKRGVLKDLLVVVYVVKDIRTADGFC